MELKETKVKIKCDMPGCKNTSKFVLNFKKMFGAGNLYFCDTCLKEMHQKITPYIVPKGIKSPYKKINEKKEEIQNEK